jgi:hypothetical protein
MDNSNLSDRRGQSPQLIHLPVHPSGLRGQAGVYGQFMSHMRAVRAEIAYLTALRDTQLHDHGLRQWYITELEAADTAYHDRNVVFVVSVGLDATVLRQSTRSIMHVDSTVLSAVYAAISQVTDSVAARQNLLGMRFWTEGDELTVRQVNIALLAAGLN